MGFRDGLENLTSSSIFLLKGLGLALKDLKKLDFINAYIDDKDHEPHYENAVYLLFKPTDMGEFRFWMMQEKERVGEMQIEDYDYDGGYVVVVYLFPDKFLREYKHWEKGEFSLFRQSYIKLFPTEVTTKGNLTTPATRAKSIYYHIFNRTSELKEYWEDVTQEEIEEDMELWSSPDLDKETLDIDKIKQAHKESMKDLET